MIKSIADIKPLFDFVLVTQFHAATDARIILPGTTAQENQQFEVLSVGPGKALEDGSTRAMSLAVGDIVVFPQCPTFPIHIAGESRKLGIINEGNVVAVVGHVSTSIRAKPADHDVRADLS